MIWRPLADLPEFSRFPDEVKRNDLSVLERINQAELDGFRRGLHEGTERAEMKAATRFAEVETGFLSRSASDKQKWFDEIGERLLHSFEIYLQSMTQDIASQLEEILRPFVRDRLHSEAIRSFEAVVVRAVQKGSKISLRGPERHVSPIADVMNARGLDATCVHSEETFLSAEIDHTLIRVEFDNWFADLEARLA